MKNRNYNQCSKDPAAASADKVLRRKGELITGSAGISKNIIFYFHKTKIKRKKRRKNFEKAGTIYETEI